MAAENTLESIDYEGKSSDNLTCRVKIICLGDSAVGKSK